MIDRHQVGFLLAMTSVLSYVAHLVARHTIDLVIARRLLPRWDLATHLGQGWLDYHLLATGQIPELIWDLWLQGYWPPLPSLYQMPFYLVLGGGMSSGLWSGLAAFVLVGVAGAWLLVRQPRGHGVLAASAFVALLMSSPSMLAYASVPMTEMLGAAAQLAVLIAYAIYRERRTPRAARLVALSLTALFFTKYNYFLLLATPLAVYEWLERTPGTPRAQRFGHLWRWTWRVVSTPTGALLALYLTALVLISRTGGFEFFVAGHRVSVRTVGNSGYVVLAAAFARVWYLYRRGRIDWSRVVGIDPLVRPLLVWFVVPVTIWFASPYPNHIRDFFNLVLNRPLGAPTVKTGIATYGDALRSSFFYDEWVLAGVALAFTAAALRYRRQPALMQCIILAVPLQLAAIAVHQTRFPRFLLLTFVLLCVGASYEAGTWLARVGRRGLVGGAIAVIVLLSGVAAARDVVTEERFRTVAFENYTDNPTLRAALDSIHGDSTPDGRLVVVGQSNELSPGMFRWELGPPSGAPCFPYEAGGVRGIDLGLATGVLLLEPSGSGFGRLDVTGFYLAQRRAVLERAARGALVLRREFPLPDMGVVLRLYDRTATEDPVARCQ